MACRVKIYDTAHKPLASSRIDLVAVDQGTRRNCCAPVSNGSLGVAHYGANLAFSAGTFVYQVAVVDLARVYAGLTVPGLNGNVAGDLDVVLYPLPTTSGGGTGGSRATTAAQVFIDIDQSSWTPYEKQGMRSVIFALMQLRGSTDPVVLGFIAQYEESLSRYGINASLF